MLLLIIAGLLSLVNLISTHTTQTVKIGALKKI
jgi:hypothetical protein